MHGDGPDGDGGEGDEDGVDAAQELRKSGDVGARGGTLVDREIGVRGGGREEGVEARGGANKCFDGVAARKGDSEDGLGGAGSAGEEGYCFHFSWVFSSLGKGQKVGN